MNNIQYGVTTISHGTFILSPHHVCAKGLQNLCSVRLQHFSIFAKLIIGDFEKKRRVKALLGQGTCLVSVYYFCVSPGHYGMNRLQAD